MNEIILAVVIVSAIGLVLGFVLSFASSIFAVKKDETEEKIRECLPGANCGACGYSGCDGYAKAIALGTAEKLNLCAPGGNEVAKKVAEVLGKEAEETEPMVAYVNCLGNCESASSKLEYTGIQSCKAENMLFGGHKACQFGCLGHGDCESICPYGAIKVTNGVAKVTPSKCKACRMCIKICPKGIISLVPKKAEKAVVSCSNKAKGVDVRKQCKVGCIGCGKCSRTCEFGAVTVSDNLARIDPEKCQGCGKCVEACPIKCIKLV